MKNIKKFGIFKIVAIILCVVLPCCAFPSTANADVLPMISGDFFWNNSLDCEYDGRSYFVDSVAGKITTYISPLETIPNGSYQNGEEITIEYTYQSEGMMWGGNNDGWVLMDNLGVIYDNKQFFIDNASEISTYEGDIFSIPIAMLYTYPNSGECYQLVEDANYLLITEAIGSFYTDEAGNEWGNIVYYYGRKNAWVCISDPTNTSLDSGVMPNLPSASSVSGKDAVVDSINSGLIPIAAVAAVGAIVITALVLVIKTKKK